MTDKNPKAMYWTKRWKDLRLKVFLRDNYFCQSCGKLCIEGDKLLNPECDHITPHKGNEDLKWDEANLQTLHHSCHTIKTNTEDGGGFTGSTPHPDWMPKPLCPVVIVCGPAGGGKNTWVMNNAPRGSQVIDLDECFKAFGNGSHGHTADRKHLSKAIRLRNKLLAMLARKKSNTTAYFIVSAPTIKEREWWKDKLNAEVIVIDPTLEEIKKRNISAKRKRLAASWYDQQSKNEWKPHSPKKARQVGLDGYPIAS